VQSLSGKQKKPHDGNWCLNLCAKHRSKSLRCSAHGTTLTDEWSHANDFETMVSSRCAGHLAALAAYIVLGVHLSCDTPSQKAMEFDPQLGQ
jgi:hypothetical protein